MTSLMFKNWLKLSLLNLLLVALIGALMRFKIIFELPFFDQKNLQHAHSHFAFAGWISQTLIIGMIWFLNHHKIIQNNKIYTRILLLNMFSAYGMLFSFTMFGYNFISITFSTTSIITTFIFSYFFYFDSQKISRNTASLPWFNAALFFNIISSLGTFALTYMMMNKQLHQHTYLSAVYWYLHFQYNGWFFFACIGLLLSQINIDLVDSKKSKIIFWMLFICCFPAYMLSVLWLNLPITLFTITALAACVQLFAWLKFIQLFKKYYIPLSIKTPKIISYLLVILSLAISLKYLLQLGSTIPSISKLAFGFRPIVIAYLHLVLLAIISVFLIYFMHLKGLFTHSKHAIGTTIFLIIAIYLNEVVLAIQGIASFDYILIPYAQETLLLVALLIVLSVFKLLLIALNTK